LSNYMGGGRPEVISEKRFSRKGLTGKGNWFGDEVSVSQKEGEGWKGRKRKRGNFGGGRIFSSA